MEALVSAKHYAALGPAGVIALKDVGEVLSRNGWVERVVQVMQSLIQTNVSLCLIWSDRGRQACLRRILVQ